MSEPKTVLVYSSSDRTRQQVLVALGRRPLPGLDI